MTAPDGRSGPAETTDARPGDARLAELLELVAGRVEAGESVDLERYRGEHPELASEIERLLPALNVLEGFGDVARVASSEPGVTKAGGGLEETHTLGDYRILREVGRGGMGVVYEAEQISLGRRVALKVLPFAAVLDQRQIQRFKNEAHAAAQLHHNNIVPVFGVGSDRGVHYYAMQLIEGQSLAEAIRELRQLEGLNGADGAERREEPKRQDATSENARQDDPTDAISSLSRILASGSFAPPVAEHGEKAADNTKVTSDSTASTSDTTHAKLRGLSTGKTSSRRTTGYLRSIAGLGRQAAEALEHAHDMGIIHRDVKPANFLLDAKGNLWVTDFGLARCRSDVSLTMSGDLLGTLRYMSPEQALAKRNLVDQRTDIYSLGVTLYELLTLEPAYSGHDREELLKKIAFEEPRSPRKLNKAIPADLETIVLKAMTKDPGGRYETAKEVAADLARFLDDRPILARRPTLLQHAAKWCRRHRRLVASIVTITVLLATTAWLVYRNYRAERERDYREWTRQASLQTSGTHLTWKTSASRAQGVLGGTGALVEQIADWFAADFDASALKGLSDHPMGDAERKLSGAIKLSPDRPDAHYHLAKVRLQVGDVSGALDSIDRALTCDRDFLPARALKAHLLDVEGRAAEASAEREQMREGAEIGWRTDWVKAQTAMLAGRWKEAVVSFERLTEEKDEAEEPYIGYLHEVYMGMGFAHFAGGEYVRALRYFTLAEAFWGRESPQPVIWQGIVHKLSGREELANEKFETVFARTEFREEAGLFLIALHMSEGEHQTALEWAEQMAPGPLREAARMLLRQWLARCREAIDVGEKAVEDYAGTPSEAILCAHLGAAYGCDGQREKAYQFLRRARDLAPTRSMIYNLISVAGLGEEESVAAALRVGRLDPHWKLSMGICRLLHRQGSYVEAEREYLRHIERDPNLAPLHAELAWTRVVLGNQRGAKESLEEARRVSPRATRALFYSGLVHQRLGDFQAAIDWYEKTIEYHRSYVAPYRMIGVIYLYDWQNPEEAVGWLRKAIEVNPHDDGSHRHLGEAYERWGKLDEAIRSYSNAIRESPGAEEVHSKLVSLLRRARSSQVPADALGEALGSLEDLAQSGIDAPQLLKTVSLGRVLVPGREDHERALSYALRAVEAGHHQNSQMYVGLAEVQDLTGDRARAIATLEGALTRPKPRRTVREKLIDLREKALPDLPTVGSIDAALERASREVIVPLGVEWRIFKGREEPPEGWMASDFDDSSWEERSSGFGYDPSGERDYVTELSDMRHNYRSLYVRRTFDLDDPRSLKLEVAVTVDDGCVVYVNGVEIGRVRAGLRGQPIPNEQGSVYTNAPTSERFEVPSVLLEPGENCVAIQGLNGWIDSSDFCLAPRIISFGASDPRRAAEVLRRFREVADGEAVQARKAYAEGRLREVSGQLPEAIEHFARAVSLAPDDPEPLLRWARDLKAAGQSERAETELRRALSQHLPDEKEIWNLWATISLADLERTPEAIIQDFPPIGNTGPGAEIRWLIERLARDEVVRINCGGDDYTSPTTGEEWAADRFFSQAERPYIAFPRLVYEPISGTDDDRIYQTRAEFPEDEIFPYHYRVPLPKARYRVTLHFAETLYLGPGHRSFDVFVEDTRVLSDYAPDAVGFATADHHSVEIVVDDGLLGVQLFARKGTPRISGIEIERIDSDR